jgi:hypothetical protein
MVQEVKVRAETGVSLKGLLESAIQSELRALQLGIQRTQVRLTEFEAQYGLNTQDFEQRFTHRQLQESLDFIDWMGEVKTLQLLEEKKRALQQLHIS